ncbi:PREDICTED: uncharacterized protein LOC104607793 isoform X1 [Nelumbo nucifera]|uniref:Uncharacterized protein LOC104607793 isoform X1 n=1 Tax=Nelumbo nucifera TaxID=4432 RepID=A0A1U8AUM8_NELNU|nr:PREDICTED: uncharacterized protein LOC104607793 isoform X1 [Nelumbo nucifera]XP_010271804.1 PREDICTED: uncharacterized protein LOC104607793 isoform X1 [Nelumbo nucifera]XP_010271805.1 PREDICTED: uncharacterized protein LOC104607793 isoform X1 [Nelumbo nucifera]
MDWYILGGYDDPIDPKHQGPIDRFPLQNYHSQSGVATLNGFASTNKYGIGMTNLTREELGLDGKFIHNEGENGIYGQSSSGSSSCRGYPMVDNNRENPEASLDRRKVPCGRPDYQLEGLTGTNRMDDIFLSLLMEQNLSNMENLASPASTFSESECSMIPFHDFLMDMIANSQCISKDLSGQCNSMNQKTHAFPPSTIWNRVMNNSYFPRPSNLEQAKDFSMKKAPLDTILNPGEICSPYKADGHLDVENSVEESVLQELKVVITQVKLTKQTRICFRDALYRLANSNRQQHMLPDGETYVDNTSSETFGELSRFGRMTPPELGKSFVDRTIENLLFNTLNCTGPNHFSQHQQTLEENLWLQLDHSTIA